MNDDPIDRLLQQVALAPELADSLLDLLPAAERERVLAAELQLFGLPPDQLAAATQRLERRLRPWRAAMQFLRDKGLRVLHAAGEVMDRVTVMPAGEAVRWLGNAIADAEDELATAHFGDAEDDLLVPVVIGDGDATPVLVPLATLPQSSAEKLRLELRVPRQLEAAHPGLRAGMAVIRLGREQDKIATTIEAVQFVAGAEPTYVVECRWPPPSKKAAKPSRPTTVPPNLIREVRLFPMPAE